MFQTARAGQLAPACFRAHLPHTPCLPSHPLSLFPADTSLPPPIFAWRKGSIWESGSLSSKTKGHVDSPRKSTRGWGCWAVKPEARRHTARDSRHLPRSAAQRPFSPQSPPNPFLAAPPRKALEFGGPWDTTHMEGGFMTERFRRTIRPI